MADLFHCSNLASSPAVLVGSEAHHALNVLRLKAGDAIDLFDGQGRYAHAIITSTTRRDLTAEFENVELQATPANSRLTVAAAIPKGDRLKWLVEKLAELGVETFIPLLAERSVVKPGTSKLNKLDATVIAAAKQSRNYRLMDIKEPARLESVLNDHIESRILIAHPGTELSSAVHADPEQPSLLLVGPEGGFTEEEVRDVVRCGGQLMSWPGSILRIETAAIVFSALLRQPA